MNYESLKDIISQIKGCTFAGIDTLTSVKLIGGKKNAMQGRVTKRTEGSSVILFSTTQSGYENMVKRRLEKEEKDSEDFQLSSRVWGTREGNSHFIFHNNKHYLEVIFLKAGKNTYLLDGVEINKNDIEGLEKTNSPDVQSQGGLEDKVIVRTYDLSSITRISLMGETLSE